MNWVLGNRPQEVGVLAASTLAAPIDGSSAVYVTVKIILLVNCGRGSMLLYNGLMHRLLCQ